MEHLTIPAGFNLRGTISIVYTKTLGADAWMDTSRPRAVSRYTGHRSNAEP